MTPQQIEDRLIQEIAKASAIPVERIDIREPFVNFGITSVDAVYLVGEIERLLGVQLEATLFWDYPTIESLTKYLAEVSK